MIEEIIQRLMSNKPILNTEFILLCNTFNISLGPRTKGFINQHITEIFLDTIDLNTETFNFTVMCTHSDSNNKEYELPNGIRETFSLFSGKLLERESE